MIFLLIFAIFLFFVSVSIFLVFLIFFIFLFLFLFLVFMFLVLLVRLGRSITVKIFQISGGLILGLTGQRNNSLSWCFGQFGRRGRHLCHRNWHLHLLISTFTTTTTFMMLGATCRLL